jgi:Protein of unknown function (DUF3631)
VITKNQLAKLLDVHGIVPNNIRLPSGKIPKGYYLRAFAEALTRYPLSKRSAVLQLRPCTHKSRLVSSGYSMSALPPIADILSLGIDVR